MEKIKIKTSQKEELKKELLILYRSVKKKVSFLLSLGISKNQLKILKKSFKTFWIKTFW